jgi:hypothetical protein
MYFENQIRYYKKIYIAKEKYLFIFLIFNSIELL